MFRLKYEQIELINRYRPTYRLPLPHSSQHRHRSRFSTARKNSPFHKSVKFGKVVGSLYCVQGTVTIKGWEHQLIERDPALAKFHWSPITAARPGRIYFRQPISVNGLKPYHNIKPRLISFDEARAMRQKKAQNNRGQSQNSTDIGLGLKGQLLNSARTDAQAYASYSTSAPSYSAVQTTSPATLKVQGRLISAK